MKVLLKTYEVCLEDDLLSFLLSQKTVGHEIVIEEDKIPPNKPLF